MFFFWSICFGVAFYLPCCSIRCGVNTCEVSFDQRRNRHRNGYALVCAHMRCFSVAKHLFFSLSLPERKRAIKTWMPLVWNVQSDSWTHVFSARYIEDEVCWNVASAFKALPILFGIWRVRKGLIRAIIFPLQSLCSCWLWCSTLSVSLGCKLSPTPTPFPWVLLHLDLIVNKGQIAFYIFNYL